LETLHDISKLWKLTPQAVSLKLHIDARDCDSCDPFATLVQCLEPANRGCPLPKIELIEGSAYQDSTSPFDPLDIREKLKDMLEKRCRAGATELTLKEDLRSMDVGMRSVKVEFQATP